MLFGLNHPAPLFPPLRRRCVIADGVQKRLRPPSEPNKDGRRNLLTSCREKSLAEPVSIVQNGRARSLIDRPRHRPKTGRDWPVIRRFWKLTAPVPFWRANGWKTLVPQYHHQGRRNHYFRIAQVYRPMLTVQSPLTSSNASFFFSIELPYCCSSVARSRQSLSRCGSGLDFLEPPCDK